MQRLLRAAALLAAASALPTGRLVGVFHAPGDVTSCSLIEVSLGTGANRTLAASVPACAQLTSNYPSFSAYTGKSLLLAVNTAPAVYAVDPATGASAPLGGLPPSNDTFPLLGLVYVEGAGALTATSLGLFNSTGPGPATLLVAFAAGEVFAGAFVVASPPHLVYVCDENSNAIVAVDLRDLSKKQLKGLAAPIGTALLSPSTLLQEKSYTLYSTALATGKSTRLLSIPNGPGYPRTNGVAGQGYWWWFDFAALHAADLKAKTTAIVGEFYGISRAMGFPVYLEV
jgi:hypothetical protein